MAEIPSLMPNRLADPFTEGAANLLADLHSDRAKQAQKADESLLDEVEHAHFNYFVEQTDKQTGLTKDRSSLGSPASIAAVGFALSSYPIGVERGWMSRDEAADNCLKAMKTLWNAPQGDDAQGESGTHGFFYHFIDTKTAVRAMNCEVSTIDTALLMSGVLFSKDYFNGNSKKEIEIRELADKLYKRVDWDWALNSDNRLSMGWKPESGFIKSDWQGYNEAMIMLVMGLGSPTHPLPADTWKKYVSTESISSYGGQKYIQFEPLFGHQYSHSWLDFRGIRDAQNQAIGFDYFENSRRATYAQNFYAQKNPFGFLGYSKLDWGLTACDGPGAAFSRKDGMRSFDFLTYAARGCPNGVDDGTIAPTAAASSIAFAPELVLPTLRHWKNTRPEIWSSIGFKDAFNPSAIPSKPSGWIDSDCLGIDQGPIVMMTENYRSGFVWNTMKRDQYMRDGLKRAGFKGAWLDKPAP